MITYEKARNIVSLHERDAMFDLWDGDIGFHRSTDGVLSVMDGHENRTTLGGLAHVSIHYGTTKLVLILSNGHEVSIPVKRVYDPESKRIQRVKPCTMWALFGQEEPPKGLYLTKEDDGYWIAFDNVTDLAPNIKYFVTGEQARAWLEARGNGKGCPP